MSDTVVLQTSLADLPVRRGKVRDVYDLGSQLLLVSTDRISAFDWVLPTGIPDKGCVLTQISGFWLELLDTPHHMITMDMAQVDLPDEVDRSMLSGRSMLVQKTEVVPIECVVRGYLAGSGWREYQQSGTVCGVRLPAHLRESDRLPEPIFTPATKAEQGLHDENISFRAMVDAVGRELAEQLQRWSIDLYARGAAYARDRGILIADTKFEFGLIDGQPILIDECLTPDSSRFWPADQYAPGRGQPSFDKQFVRDWLTAYGWDKSSPPPALPDDIVVKTRQKYVAAYEQLTGQAAGW
ncbi:MAG: phosphoribosylaminoimidazolesuccinocarboxamide synthase [Planctomycetes bacterium RBG_16_64_10]|nr:MAG: phosphoribosylaminoimidazolesuccinocarboxamide synthase [Planctomycetes bacterium RBG_16_64_10]